MNNIYYLCQINRIVDGKFKPLKFTCKSTRSRLHWQRQFLREGYMFTCIRIPEEIHQELFDNPDKLR